MKFKTLQEQKEYLEKAIANFKSPELTKEQVRRGKEEASRIRFIEKLR